MIHKGWRVIKPLHNQNPTKVAILDLQLERF